MFFRRPSPYLLLTLTVLFWAGNFIVGRAVRGALPPAGLAFWRWAIALLILAPFAARPVRAEFSEILRHWKLLLLFGLIGVAAFSTLIYVGLTETTATNALLLNSAAPVMIVLIGWWFLGETITVVQAAGVTVSLAGVGTIIFKGEWTGLLAMRFTVGDLWVLAAVSLWAVYTVLLRYRPATISPIVFLATTIAVGVALNFLIHVVELLAGARMNFTSANVAGLIYIGVFPSLASHMFWNRAVAEVGANRAGLFIHLMPLFGAGMAAAFLGETLHPYHAAGMLLILSGIGLATWRRRLPLPAQTRGDDTKR